MHYTIGIIGISSVGVYQLKTMRSCVDNACIATNTLFEVPYFAADDSSLFYSHGLPYSPEWKRPLVWSHISQLVSHHTLGRNNITLDCTNDFMQTFKYMNS